MITYKERIKVIIFPILKGYSLALGTAGLYILLMNIICVQGAFSSIFATFGADLSGSSLILNNQGRLGLTLLFLGFFILNSAINQAVKVVTPE